MVVFREIQSWRRREGQRRECGLSDRDIDSLLDESAACQLESDLDAAEYRRRYAEALEQ